MYINIRAPSEKKIHELEVCELINPNPFNPEYNIKDNISHMRKIHSSKYKKYPGGI